MFKGIDFTYPEYTVVTPQTGITYGVRSLTVDEVEELKGAITTPSRATQILNEVLWKSIVHKPDFVKDIKQFNKVTTLIDREALMYALYITSFGDDAEFTPSCEKCGKSRGTIKVKLSDMFTINLYPGSQGAKASYVASARSNAPIDPVIENMIARNNVGNAPQAGGPLGIPEDVAKTIMMDSDLGGIPSQNAYQRKAAPVVNQPEEDIDPVQQAASMGIGVGKAVTSPPPAQRRVASNASQDIAPPRVVYEEQEAPSYEPPQNVVPIQAPVGNFGKSELDNPDSILRKEFSIVLPVSGITMVLMQPTIDDENNILGSVPFAGKDSIKKLNDTLIIKRFEVYENGASRPKEVITDREEIFFTYGKLVPRDTKVMNKAFRENFGQYRISLEKKWKCINCDHENSLGVEIVSYFFRMVLSEE